MEVVFATKGLVASACYYYDTYNSNEYYTGVILSICEKNMVISWEDASNLLATLTGVADNHYQPTIIGVNNWLSPSVPGSWNTHVSIDTDSVRFDNSNQPIPIRKVIVVLQTCLTQQCLVTCYRDTSDTIDLRCVTDNYQFYITRGSGYHFIPVGNVAYCTSSMISPLIELSNQTREALTRVRGVKYELY